MTGERPTLAEVLEATAKDAFYEARNAGRTMHQAGEDAGRRGADAALAWVLDVLADEALLEALDARPGCEHEREAWREYSYILHCMRCALNVVRERFEAER